MRIHCSKGQSTAGFTLMEVVVAFVFLVIGSGGVLSLLVATQNQGRSNREVIIATEAAESMLERLKGAEFAQVFALFNADASDDPGPDPAPGGDFDVPFLSSQEGDADGMAGRIVFPESDGRIRENFADDRLGMPRDLNMDGLVDSEDHTADCRVLPVRVEVAWSGMNGDASIQLALTLRKDSGRN